MKLLPTARIAGRALLRNKMRSSLTALGIVIGVGAVIAMVAIGEGAKRRVQQTFEAMGTNLLIVLPGSTSFGGLRGGFGSQPTLTWEDLRAIQTEARSVRLAAPILRTQSAVESEDQNWTTSVVGTTPDYFTLRTWQVARGRGIEAADNDSGAKVVVLGETVAKKLYGAEANPVGRLVRIKHMPFEVIGVLQKKGQSPMGQDYDDTVCMPVKTFQTKIQGGLSNFIAGVIFVSAVNADSTARAQAQITSLLRDRHHLHAGAEDDFSIRNLAEIAEAQEQGTRVLTTLLAAIAAVALIVGGIGIMNIMLVSVTERTREIGLRMAVGAKPRDVLTQFVVEALALAVSGGALGVVFGLLAGFYLSLQFHWPMVVRADIVALSVVFSAAVGLGFGLYPARKASRLDPIEALRYE
jgi:putative ABC transport system permease protein